MSVKYYISIFVSFILLSFTIPVKTQHIYFTPTSLFIKPITPTPIYLSSFSTDKNNRNNIFFMYSLNGYNKKLYFNYLYTINTKDDMRLIYKYNFPFGDILNPYQTDPFNSVANGFVYGFIDAIRIRK